MRRLHEHMEDNFFEEDVRQDVSDPQYGFKDEELPNLVKAVVNYLRNLCLPLNQIEPNIRGKQLSLACGWKNFEMNLEEIQETAENAVALAYARMRAINIGVALMRASQRSQH